ncbi:MAG: hypothetical protein HY926_15425 [Elusimicrobia bacterium]|nr:hypothetical protein [Elusimicrobiota bacterium]
MEQGKALRQLEGKLSMVGDHVSVLSGKLEDLLFRAQRIAHSLKEDGKSKVKVADTMFGYDLQTFRRDVRAFGQEAGGLSSVLGSLEHGAAYDESSVMHAQAVMRLADRAHKGVSALLDKAVLAHQHIREAEHKVEAWYMVQEMTSLAQMTQVLPGMANKVLLGVSSRKAGEPVPAPADAPAHSGGGGPVHAPASVSGPILQRKAAVPLRPVGRMVQGSVVNLPAIPPAPPPRP